MTFDELEEAIVARCKKMGIAVRLVRQNRTGLQTHRMRFMTRHPNKTGLAPKDINTNAQMDRSSAVRSCGYVSLLCFSVIDFVISVISPFSSKHLGWEMFILFA